MALDRHCIIGVGCGASETRGETGRASMYERRQAAVAGDLRNNFSWSFSRHRVFEECRRRYYLQYYGSWNGWSADGPERARLAYRLKNMQSLPMWIGAIVHRIVERIVSDLRNREDRGLEAYQKQARDLMNREWKQSLDGEWMHKPKYNLNLFEHYYGVDVTAEERVAARDKVFACLDHFMNGDLFADLARLRPAEWKSIEKLDQFVVNGHPVFVKVDCATRTEPTPEGAPARLIIYDWKTGKEAEEAEAQLGCYALYACQVWRVPLEEVQLMLAYLPRTRCAASRPAPPTCCKRRTSSWPRWTRWSRPSTRRPKRTAPHSPGSLSRRAAACAAAVSSGRSASAPANGATASSQPRRRPAVR